MNGTSDTGPPYGPGGPTDAGRHRTARRRGRVSAPVRTGLLGASAAMAIGVVAMASGLFSGGDTLQLGGGSPGGQVRADDPPVLRSDPQPRAQAPAPDRGGLPVSRGAQRPEARPAPSTDAAPPSSDPSSEAPSPEPDGSGIDPGSEAHTLPATVPGTAAADLPAADPGDPDTATEAVSLQAAPVAQILALVNQERAKVGARPLAPSPRLASLAQSFSDDMARRGFFAHTDPDGRTPWDRAAGRGIGNLGGENIARGQPDPRAVMEAWMNSTGHRANILNREYRTLGIGVHPGAGGPWWTQDFGY
ncbi:CAP domain-containing protein [Streptomyces sp. NPDC051162]|uniref:CAP domain-containing protein n=1 Tax=Streptomyces sp. NPDC051162 TaxID=3154747 RepID=UPI00342B5FCF